MSNEERNKPAPAAPLPAGESAVGSGEGANTALEALIRKRRQAETPDPVDPVPPLPPAFPFVPSP